MRVFFIGCVEFSYRMLKTTFESEFVDVIGVATREVSKGNSDFFDLLPFAKKNNIPCRYINDINSPESIDWIKSLKPDIIFCFGWSFLLKRDILNIPAKGVVGYHPSKLPQNRGRHPLIWALALGLEESASTFFFMDEGADSGPIISQKNFPISDSDTAFSLYQKIQELAAIQLDEILRKGDSILNEAIPQDDVLANEWRKRGKPDGEIDFRMSSIQIRNLVRALSKPYPGAHFVYKGQDIVVFELEILEEKRQNLEPGKVLESNEDSILVKTGNGAVLFKDLKAKVLPIKGEYIL